MGHSQTSRLSRQTDYTAQRYKNEAFFSYFIEKNIVIVKVSYLRVWNIFKYL